MRAKGLSRAEVFGKLSKAKAKDLRYEDGKILCSMCSRPHPVAMRAHDLFLESNLGDPGLFSGTVQLEREAVASLVKLLHGTASATGFIVSGGTEANLLALYSARKAARVARPEVIVPESAHFSFEKICDMLGLKLIKARLDSNYVVDPVSVQENINSNTIAIVGSAGSAELGAVDPIAALSKIAQKHSLPLHVDAAFGGLVLPFLYELGYPVQDFDFSVSNVQSITVDPHKMGLSPIPAGCILFRESNALRFIRTDTPYLTEPFQYTFVGTRSGASVASVWAVFECSGREGFRQIVKRCMGLTAFLRSELEEASFELVAKPVLNIVAFRGENSKRLVGLLRERGWYVSYVPRLDCVRVVLMPHTTKQHVSDFVQLLRELARA